MRRTLTSAANWRSMLGQALQLDDGIQLEGVLQGPVGGLLGGGEAQQVALPHVLLAGRVGQTGRLGIAGCLRKTTRLVSV